MDRFENFIYAKKVIANEIKFNEVKLENVDLSFGNLIAISATCEYLLLKQANGNLAWYVIPEFRLLEDLNNKFDSKYSSLKWLERIYKANDFIYITSYKTFVDFLSKLL